VSISKEIGTYETSILPYEDCCTIFSPKHPLVRPNREELTEDFAAMGIESLLERAVGETESLTL
jgi:thiamine biosynthesis protein ThiI